MFTLYVIIIILLKTEEGVSSESSLPPVLI